MKCQNCGHVELDHRAFVLDGKVHQFEGTCSMCRCKRFVGESILEPEPEEELTLS